MVKIKRAYEPANKTDGFRVLVDRLWPRGLKKADLRLNEWKKELAPSTALRQAFSHDPAKWPQFRSQYDRNNAVVLRDVLTRKTRGASHL